MIDIKSQIIKPALKLKDIRVVASAEGWKLTDLRSLGFFLERNFKYRRAITITSQSGSVSGSSTDNKLLKGLGGDDIRMTRSRVASLWVRRATFAYKRGITITELSGNDLTDYQVRIDLDATNFNFEHAQPNGEDVRFVDAGGNFLSYWIEEWDSVNKKAKVWVKVPSIPANGSTEIWMYYGNPTAESVSDGKATFEFFDDFNSYTTVQDYFTKEADDLASASIGIVRYKSPFTWVLALSTDKKNVLWRYDHNNKTWKRIASFSVSDQDGHRIGNVLVDSQNNIHVFHDSGGGSTDGIKHEKSTDGGETWSSKIAVSSDPANNEGPEYQNCVEWDGILYLFHGWAMPTDGGVKGVWQVTKSTDYGETWGTPETIIDPTTDYPNDGVYVNIPYQKDNIIHFSWTRWLDGVKGTRKHVYYAYLDLNTMTFYNINGTNLGSLITGAEMDNYCLAKSTDFKIAFAKLIGLDENNYPHIVFVNIDVSPYEIHHLYWNGSQWVDEIVTTSSVENVANGIVHASNDIELFVGQSDRVERWKYDGSSWSKVEDIPTGVAVRKPNCRHPYNDEIKAVFVEYTGDWTSPAKYFAWGVNGFVGRPVPDISQMEGVYTIVSGDFELSEEPSGSGNGVLKGIGSEASLITHNSANISTGKVIRAKLRIDSSLSDAASGIVFGFQDSSNFYHVRIHTLDELQIYEWVGGSASKKGSASVTINTDTWYILEIIWSDANTIEAKVYDASENLLATASATMTGGFSSGKIGFRLYRPGSADDIRIRKYTEPEPSVSLGEEETA